MFVSIAPGADGAPRPTSALRQIYLRHNAIADLESAADELRQHPALELLALSHNSISTIAGAGLSALRSLRVLDGAIDCVVWLFAVVCVLDVVVVVVCM